MTKGYLRSYSTIVNHTHNTISMALHHLVGGLEHFLFFPSYWEYIIIPTDEVIFFRGVGLNHQPDHYISYISVMWIHQLHQSLYISNHQPVIFHPILVTSIPIFAGSPFGDHPGREGCRRCRSSILGPGSSQ